MSPVRLLAGGPSPIFLASKSITFDGAAGTGAVGAVPLFTVTGSLIVVYILGIVTTTLTGASGTLALGTTSHTSEFIAATTATTLTTTNNIWMSTTATAGSMAMPALIKEQVVTENILMTAAVSAGVTGGVMRIDCYWMPLGAGATVV